MSKLNHRLVAPAYHAPTLPDGHKLKPFRKILGIHANGHDAGACIVEDGIVTEVIEFERVFGEKHCRLNVLHPRFDHHMAWLFREHGLPADFDAVALHLHHFGSEPREYTEMVQNRAVEVLSAHLPDAHYLELSHHLCHAASSYFTSPFDDAVILSFDGHGHDGSTVGFHGKGGTINYVRGWPFSMGRAYAALSNIVGGIHAKDGNAAGKVMGLTAYGQIVPEWIAPIKKFITTYTGLRSEFSPLYWEAGVADGQFVLPGFGTIEGKGAFKGPEDPQAQNFAATYQHVWSSVVQDIVRELMDTTDSRRVCLVGGCALNATTNYDIMQMPGVEDLHLIPNPSDCGLSVGAALYTAYAYQKAPWNGAQARYASAYLGLPILDIDELETLAAQRGAKRLAQPASDLAALIAQGAKIGLMQGRAEVGPRALGNRSIICDPRRADMKDLINQQIKGREWYRPFAPVVREGEQDRYFIMPRPAPYMSFIADVRPEWKERVPAITHADGTARVQTVTAEQNPFLWELLGAYEKETGIGMLLNTSFNGSGEAIYSRISEALSLLDRTDLDGVYVEGVLFQ